MKKVHYAWIINAACFLILMNLSGLVLAATSTFLKPVSEALNVSRTQFSSYTLVSGALGMVASLNGGKILKKLGIRKAVVLGGCMAAAALFGYSGSSAVWQFWAWGALAGFGAGFASVLPCSVLLNNWFVEKKGLATSIAFLGTTTGTLVFSRLAGTLIGTVGWRFAYLALAVILLVIVIPTALLLVVEHPDKKGLLAYGASDESAARQAAGTQDGILRKDFVGTPTFRAAAGACLLSGIVILGVQNHLLAFLSDLGYTAASAANVYTALLIVQMAGKIILGAILDRFGIRVGLIYICVFHLLAMFGMLFAGMSVFACVGAVGLGLSAGVCTIVPPVLTATLVGPRDYANILGLINVFVSLGSTASTTVTSVIYDVTGGYASAWILCAGGMILLTVLMLLSLQTGKTLLNQTKEAG